MTTPDPNLASWNELFDRKREVSVADDVFCVYEGGSLEDNVVLVFLHGCGHTSMSWALVARDLKSHFGVLAFDYRGHGETRCKNDFDLSTDTLVNDAVAIIQKSLPPTAFIALVGHSLGGSVAVRIANTEKVKIAGVCMVDIVEGTAIPALAHMPRFIAQRPKSFGSVADAIDYITNTGTIRSREAAQISIPYQLRLNKESGRWEWRTDLAKSEPYWLSWYQGLTEMFLHLKCAKLLVLASTDRMDKDILISQMQGKLQVEIIAGCHSIQEDSAQELSKILRQFIDRNRFSQLAAINAKWAAKRS